MSSEETFKLDWQFFKDNFKEGMLGFFRPVIWSWKWFRQQGLGRGLTTLLMALGAFDVAGILVHFQPQIEAAARYADKLPDPDPYFWGLFWFMIAFALVSTVAIILLAVIARLMKR
jgi:hypothetical protein